MVDDQPSIRLLLTELLQAEGFQVEQAEDGVRALELYKTFLPDLLVLDMKMPLMNGIEILRQLSLEQHRPHVIMMSAYNEFDFIEQASSLGVSAYISKPFDIEEICAQIIRMLDVN